MTEPTSTGLGAFAGWKLIGGAAGLAAGGAGLAAVVVMLMTPPRSPKEWAVGLISTVVSSIAGGAYLLNAMGLSDLAQTGPVGLAVLFGLCFACGLPGWTLVRVVFTSLMKRQDKDISEIAAEVRRQIANSQ